MNVWVVEFIQVCHNYHEGVNSSSVENCTLLGYYTASSRNFLLTFWDNLSVPSSEVTSCIYCCCCAFISSACYGWPIGFWFSSDVTVLLKLRIARVTLGSSEISQLLKQELYLLQELCPEKAVSYFLSTNNSSE
jgi:hypothetical protein